MTTETDTARCVRDGVHYTTQRHPHTECPTYVADPEPKYKVPTYEGEDYTTSAIYNALCELFWDQGTQGVLMSENPIGDNIKRAKKAAEAVRTYAKECGLYEGENILLAMGDLMNDLRHLLDFVALTEGADAADGYSPDLEEMASRSLHYDAEIRGEF